MYVHALQGPRTRRELDCPKPNSQGSICPPIDTMLELDVILSCDFSVRSIFLLRNERCPPRSFKGMSGPPVVRSRRTVTPKHGIAYLPRGTWRRSLHSNQRT